MIFKYFQTPNAYFNICHVFLQTLGFSQAHRLPPIFGSIVRIFNPHLVTWFRIRDNIKHNFQKATSSFLESLTNPCVFSERQR